MSGRYRAAKRQHEAGRSSTESEQRLIDRAFEAFGWRTRPAAAFVASWVGRPGLEGTPDQILGVVPRRDIDGALLDSVFVHATDILGFATVEGCLYYLPVMIARCVRDPEGADLLPDAMLSQLRRRPYQPVMAQWPRLVDAAAGDKPALADPKTARIAELGRGYVLRDIKHWLMVGDAWRRTAELLERMTDAERRILAAFFDHLAAVGRLDGADVSVAKALLARRGVMEVLDLRTHAECAELVGVLERLETKHPTHFPPAQVAPLKTALLDVVAARLPNTRGRHPERPERAAKAGKEAGRRRLSESEQQLIDRTFDAFAWRKKPARAFATWDYVAPDELLAGIAPREITGELLDSLFVAPDDILPYATAAGRLYYLPLVVSLCVRGDSDDFLQDVIVWQFRYCPYAGHPIAKLPLLVDDDAEDVARVPRVRSWLMMSVPERGDPWTWRQTLGLVSAMTAAERDALVAFFDYRPACADLDDRSVASARALLAGSGLMEVLRLRTHAECMEMVEVLDELTARHPAEFPSAAAAPLKNALLDIVAGRRSPDATLGW